MRKLDPSSAAVLAHFGNELRRYRDVAGMSRDALGRECWVSGSLVKAIESAQRIPSQDFTERAEKALGLGTGGPLFRLWEEAVWPIVSRRQSHPSYFGPFAEIEAKATMLREFHPVAVPGLLQTADYARAVLRKTRPDYNEEQVEEFVAAKLERQAILDNDEAPTLVVVLDEPVLGHVVGSREIMRAQLEALLKAAQRPNIIVQVVPASGDAGVGLAGMFTIASLNDHGGEVLYYETAATGQLVNRTEDVAACATAFEVAKAEALPREQSLELIREYIKEYEQ